MEKIIGMMFVGAMLTAASKGDNFDMGRKEDRWDVPRAPTPTCEFAKDMQKALREQLR